MDEFDRGGERDVARAAIAAEPRGGEGEHRAQPLAAGGDDMAGELRDQRDRAVHPLEDKRVDAFRSSSEGPLAGRATHSARICLPWH